MATPIQMPSLSPTMQEGKITRWLKKVGDKVSSGEALAEVETDKSNLEIEAYDDGYLLQISVEEGASAKVGAPIAYLGEQGEKLEAAAPAAEPAPPAPPAQKKAEAKAPAARPSPQAPPPAQERPKAPAAPAAPERGERVRASPLARKMAQDQGLELSALRGSGPQGRIVKRDVEQAKEAPRPAPAAAKGERPAPLRVELSGMRKVIAQRMGEVKPGVPHFYLTIEVEMDQALAIREEAKAMDSKVSVNDIIVKAAALALLRVPKVNVSFGGDHALQLRTADVGVAVALEEGLITPVIRDADRKGLAQISQESRDLANRARERKLRPEEYTGGSITVSNLGMFGIDSFVAVINPPQASIIAVGAVIDKPVVRDGQVVVRKMMSATFSGDHRVIDGAVGAVYLQELKALLEHPLRLLL